MSQAAKETPHCHREIPFAWRRQVSYPLGTLSDICYDPSRRLQKACFGTLEDALWMLKTSHVCILIQLDKYRTVQQNEKFDLENLPQDGETLWGTLISVGDDGQHSSGFFTYEGLVEEGTINISQVPNDAVKHL